MLEGFAGVVRPWSFMGAPAPCRRVPSAGMRFGSFRPQIAYLQTRQFEQNIARSHDKKESRRRIHSCASDRPGLPVVSPHGGMDGPFGAAVGGRLVASSGTGAVARGVGVVREKSSADFHG